MSKPKFCTWSYVLLLNDTVVGAFPSASLAYAHWLAFAEKYSNPDDPFVSCKRYRYCMDPYFPEEQDVTMLFIKQWQTIRDLKEKEKEQ